MFYFYLLITVIIILVSILVRDFIKSLSNPERETMFGSLTLFGKIKLLGTTVILIGLVIWDSAPDKDNPLGGRWSNGETYFVFEAQKYKRKFISGSGAYSIYPLESKSVHFASGSEKYYAIDDKTIHFFEKTPDNKYKQCDFYGILESFNVIQLYPGSAPSVYGMPKNDLEVYYEQYVLSKGNSREALYRN